MYHHDEKEQAEPARLATKYTGQYSAHSSESRRTDATRQEHRIQRVPFSEQTRQIRLQPPDLHEEEEADRAHVAGGFCDWLLLHDEGGVRVRGRVHKLAVVAGGAQNK